MPARTPLVELVAALRRQYGAPPPPRVSTPFEFVLLENVAYLVNDERRAETYDRLAAEVGTAPEDLLAVPAATLARVIEKGGMHPARRADKLHRAAELALDMGLDVLQRTIREDPAAARRLLKRFPGLGDPGAEWVLVQQGAWRGLAPDSNGLRVLLRAGWGSESKDYRKAYRSAADAVEPELRDDTAWLVEAHQLLRTHGQELCKNSAPKCEACPWASRCPSAATTRRG